LKVRLEQVRAFLDRALIPIGQNSQLLQSLVRTVDRTVGEVGGRGMGADGEPGCRTSDRQQAQDRGRNRYGRGGRRVGAA
jgi:hypothetical protein